MKSAIRNFLPAAALVLLAFCSTGAFAHDDAIREKISHLASEDLRIPSDTPGIELFLRNKRAKEGTASADHVLLYVHGATYPSETAFDLRLDGMSWMDYIAAQGWDVWLVDLRGYSKSTRPPEMDKPAAENEPIVRTETAVKDVGAAVDFILKRRGVAKINLLGWSWGTTIMGWYTAQNNDKVAKLVLYAPAWVRNSASLTDAGGKLGAYRSVSRDAAKGRWLSGVAEDKKADLIPAGWFEAWADATWTTDPNSKDAGLLRAPNGVIQDVRDYWASGKTYYDAANIRVPTLLIKAEWDQDTPTYMAQALFARLTSTPMKRYVEIGEGTHTVIMEKNRMQLFREVQLFLED